MGDQSLNLPRSCSSRKKPSFPSRPSFCSPQPRSRLTQNWKNLRAHYVQRRTNTVKPNGQSPVLVAGQGTGVVHLLQIIVVVSRLLSLGLETITLVDSSLCPLFLLTSRMRALISTPKTSSRSIAMSRYDCIIHPP